MLEKTFCSSPWFHMTIQKDGSMQYCRWQVTNPTIHNIKTMSVEDYFQKVLAAIRVDMLNGKTIPGCYSCHKMERHGKISGRQKQLLKTGITEKNFTNSFRSSPYFDKIKHSFDNKGLTDLLPVDWQIHLGNYCNSACMMCVPSSSSKLANEWHKLGLIKEKYVSNNWSEDDVALEKFFEILKRTKKIRYIHLLGGETILMPAFEKILNFLINNDMHKTVTLGFTTNLTVYPKKIIALLKQFKYLHVGLSIETLDKLNDFIRWPSQIDNVKNNLDNFVELSKQKGWVVSIRTTPTLLSVGRMLPLYEYALEKNIGIEACDFLYEPDYLKINLLPKELRMPIVQDIENFLQNNNYQPQEKVLNVRNPSTVKDYVYQDLISYKNYLLNEPHDSTNEKKFINFVKKIENNRKQKITDYMPEYEKFFRNIGY